MCGGEYYLILILGGFLCNASDFVDASKRGLFAATRYLGGKFLSLLAHYSVLLFGIQNNLIQLYIVVCLFFLLSVFCVYYNNRNKTIF